MTERERERERESKIGRDYIPLMTVKIGMSI
jgi:hypothetical protein